MKKQIFRLVQALILCALLTASVCAADLLYAENFDALTLSEGSNPNNWCFYKGKASSTSTVTIKDGAMYFEANSAGYDVVYVEGRSFSNYTLEADVTFLKATGWFGLAYNVQSGKVWQKGTLGPSSTTWSLNGYSSGWKNNSKTDNMGKFDNSALAVNDTVRIRITTNGATATMSYAEYTSTGPENWITLGSISNIPAGCQSGSIGFMMGANANNTSIKVDNVCVISNAEKTAGQILFEEDFEELPLSVGKNGGVGLTYYTKNASSSAIIKNGALHFSRTGTDDGYDLLYLTEGAFKNYTVEADVTYLSPTAEENGWAGLAFNVGAYHTYFEASLSCHDRASISGLIANAWQYDTEGVNKKAFAAKISEGEPFRIKVTTAGSSATLSYAFYDQKGSLSAYTEVMTVQNIPADRQHGSIGFMLAQGTTTSVVIDNVQVTSNKEIFNDIADVYVPKTGIVNPAVVVQTVTDRLPDTSSRPPAVALLTIDAQMNVLAADGSVLAPVDAFMRQCSKTVIPAFIIDSESEATALAEYMSSAYVADAFVVADSKAADLVVSVRKQCPTVRGALIFDSLATDAERKAARALVHDNKSYVAIAKQMPDADAIRYFNARQVAVWSYAADAADVYTAIANGCNGLIASAPATVYDVYENITQTTVSGEPIIIAHRGARVDTPENTLLAFREAVDKYGAQAIETDIRISADGVSCLMHDSTVDRTTNGTGTLASKTMQQLKALTVDEKAANKTVVPTWEEVVKEFKDTDIVFYCHINVASYTNIKEFSRIVTEYGFEDNVVFFISYTYVPTYTADSPIICDGIPFVAGDAPALVAGETDLDCIRMFLENLTASNYQALFYDYDGYANESFYYQLSARGFLNCHSITNGQSKLDTTLLTSLGAVGALTDDLPMTSNYAYRVEASDVVLSAGKTIPTKQTVLRITEDTEETCGFVQLDGTPLVKTADGYAMADTEAVTLVYYADVRAGASSYRVYSVPVTVRHADKAAAVTLKMTLGKTEYTVNGETKVMDVAPIIRKDRTMLPVRYVAEALGASIGWDGSTSTATLTTADTEVRITVGAESAIVNGQTVTLDSPAFIESSRTYMPVRFVAEALGASVAWDAPTSTATITK